MNEHSMWRLTLDDCDGMVALAAPDYPSAEANFLVEVRTAYCGMAGIAGLLTLGLAGAGHPAAFAAMALAVLSAFLAVRVERRILQHRIDSLFARALAADLAEGAEPTQLSEAA